MCGIMGYIGPQQVTPILLDGLKHLEYRGYDSAGVAVLQESLSNFSLTVIRSQGKLGQLQQKLEKHSLPGHVGIGHTRWATHGKPSDENAHPHHYGSVALIHNGIIENYLELKHELLKKGHVFTSETDTEIVAHLIDEELAHCDSLLTATQHVLPRLKGAYALVIVSSKTPEEIVCAKNASPLVLGFGEGEMFIASDIPAILPYTRKILFLEEGEIAQVTRQGATVYNTAGEQQLRKPKEISWSVALAEKEGFKHFMLKEIHEQSRSVTDTLRGRVHQEPASVSIDGLVFDDFKRIFLVACGTSFHAARIGEYLIEELAKIPCKSDLASEFRNRDPLVGPDDLIIAISQSGETADTLAALREAKKRGAKVLSISNIVDSSIARASDYAFYTHAGLEIGVASTKAFTAQLVALLLLAIHFGQQRRTLDSKTIESLVQELLELPIKIQETLLQTTPTVQAIAKQHLHVRDFLFLGRGLQYPIALEGALKVKELSYVHAEGYAAGELKHGPIALIEEGLPVLVIAVQDRDYEKVFSNLSEVKARGAWTIAIATEGDKHISTVANDVLYIPAISPFLAPLLTVLPLQMLSYFMADLKGNDVDQPRNLAKSVTVE